METKILRNRIRCRICGDEIESIHVHDFKWCKCKSVAIDGGTEYLKRMGNLDDFVELSELKDEQGNNSTT